MSQKNSKLFEKRDTTQRRIPHIVDMCGVEGKRRLCDLKVTSSSPALATTQIL